MSHPNPVVLALLLVYGNIDVLY